MGKAGWQLSRLARRLAGFAGSSHAGVIPTNGKERPTNTGIERGRTGAASAGAVVKGGEIQMRDGRDEHWLEVDGTVGAANRTVCPARVLRFAFILVATDKQKQFSFILCAFSLKKVQNDRTLYRKHE